MYYVLCYFHDCKALLGSSLLIYPSFTFISISNYISMTPSGFGVLVCDKKSIQLVKIPAPITSLYSESSNVAARSGYVTGCISGLNCSNSRQLAATQKSTSNSSGSGGSSSNHRTVKFQRCTNNQFQHTL